MDARTTPTPAQIYAALGALPDGYCAMGRFIIAAPGVTAHELLRVAEALRAGARERRGLFPHGDTDTRGMERLAVILEDAANPTRFPHPPRVPLSALEADASIRRHASAAGLSTAGGDS